MIEMKSKRNRVWLNTEDNCIYKRILPAPDRPRPAAAANQEAAVLRELYQSGVPVPRVFSCENGVLKMEYIRGLTLTEMIERADTGPAAFTAEDLTGMILGWFEKFYAAVPADRRRGDVNGRNFIAAENRRLLSVDFEQLPLAPREQDIGQMAAYILTYDPPYTPFKMHFAEKLLAGFVEKFNLNDEKAKLYREKELNAIRGRR